MTHARSTTRSTARDQARDTALPAPVITRLVPRPAVPAPREARDHPAVQGTLALDEDRLPDGPSTTPPPCRTPDVADRELRAWTARFAQALVEVVGGHRPVAQLVRWTSREVFRDLERRTRLVQQASTTSRDPLPLRSTALAEVRSVHVSRPSPLVAEVSVHVSHGRRSRAVALRLDLRQGRWICTALDFS